MWRKTAQRAKASQINVHLFVFFRGCKCRHVCTNDYQCSDIILSLNTPLCGRTVLQLMLGNHFDCPPKAGHAEAILRYQAPVAE